MRLKTKVLNFENKPVRYRIGEMKNEYYYFVYLYIDGNEQGFMQYSLAADHLYIHRMYNHSVKSAAPYKYIGYAFFEYAFRKSLAAGKEGRIELDAIEASPPAYFKMGFRKKISTKEQAEQQLRTYQNHPTPALKMAIQNSDYYASMRENAVLMIYPELFEKHSYSCFEMAEFKEKGKALTFEQIIACGIVSFRNKSFAELLKQGKRLNSSNCYCAGMHGMMFLPPDIVAQKRQEFSPSPPIGSNLFFSREYALANIKNESLKEFVVQGKLDASNAVEIDAKIAANDPRLALLLSDLGLKMLKENYISGWYIGVYFHSLASVRAIISENARQVFEERLVEDVGQFVGLDPKAISLVLSDQGLSALRDGRIVPIANNPGFKDHHGNYLDSSRLSEILGVPLLQLIHNQ